MNLPRLQSFTLAILLTVVTAERAVAEDAPSRLDELMAGYVLNFTKFVQWPESSRSDELVICVAGNTGLYNALRSGTGTASGHAHPVAVRSVGDAPSAAGCHVLYIEPASPLQLTQLTQLGASAPLLTVSDSNGFAHSGGTIELFTQANRLRFIINLESARRAGLRISSNLLQLAASVEGGDTR